MSGTIFNPPYPLNEDVDGDGKITFERDDIPVAQRETLGRYLSQLTRGYAPGSIDENPAGEVVNPVEYDGQIPPNHANPYPIASPDATQISYTSTAAGSIREAIDLEQKPSEIFGNIEDLVDVSPLGQARSDAIGTGPALLNGIVGSSSPGAGTRVVTTPAKEYVTRLSDALSKKNRYYGKTIVNELEISNDNSFAVDDGSFPRTAARKRLGDTLSDSLLGNGTSAITLSPSLSTSRVPSDATGANAGPIKAEEFAKIASEMMLRATGKSKPSDKSDVQLGKKQLNTDDFRAANATGFENFNMTTMRGGGDGLPTDDGAGSTSYNSRTWGVMNSPDEPFTGFDTASATFRAFVFSMTFLYIILTVAAIGLVIPPIFPTQIPAEVNGSLYFGPRKLKSGKFRYEERPGFLSVLGDIAEAASNVTGLDINIPIYRPTNKYAGYGDCVIAGLASFLGSTYGIDPNIILDTGFFKLNGNTPIISLTIATRLGALLLDPNQRQYYLNIIRVLNRSAGEITVPPLTDFSGALTSVNNLFNSTLFKFVNTLASIGDIMYTQAAAIDYRLTDVEVTPAAAYDGKTGFSLSNPIDKIVARGFASRRIKGDKLIGQRGGTISLSDLPSAHLIPNGSTQSYRSMLGQDSAISKRIQSFSPEKVSGRLRLKQEDVRRLESILDAEYMPFYFQDLRTNEIVAFHAFLEDVTDSYSANFNATSGYGRIDEVQTYKDTKRSVGCTFHIVGMNPQDFDYMWWQINKLTTMVYPQWSKGRSLKTGDTGIDFTQPFSQIPTATPMIRVRIGDLIRSNYSRFNLKRLFGYQDEDKKQSISSLAAASAYRINRDIQYTVEGLTGGKEENVTLTKGTLVYVDETAYRIIGGAYTGRRITNTYTSSPPDWLTREESLSNFDRNASITNFYDPGSNSIVKSFETTMGMGLAAVVKQLQFTWMSQDIVWGAGEDGPGNRAPRSCKVQLGFEPIHDIAPGLDHEGFNRAPIYPVGNLVNKIVEGGEAEPYGAGTSQSGELAKSIGADKAVYEETIKPSVLSRLF